jgi:hypothetical protein
MRKSLIIIALLVILLIGIMGCSAKTTDAVNINLDLYGSGNPQTHWETTEGDLIDDYNGNVLIITPNSYSSSYASQLTTTAILELHKRNKVITSISFIPYTGFSNNARYIYICYTDSPTVIK